MPDHRLPRPSPNPSFSPKTAQPTPLNALSNAFPRVYGLISVRHVCTTNFDMPFDLLVGRCLRAAASGGCSLPCFCYLARQPRAPCLRPALHCLRVAGARARALWSSWHQGEGARVEGGACPHPCVLRVPRSYLPGSRPTTPCLVSSPWSVDRRVHPGEEQHLARLL
jgi:hypothetical protein